MDPIYQRLAVVRYSTVVPAVTPSPEPEVHLSLTPNPEASNRLVIKHSRTAP